MSTLTYLLVSTLAVGNNDVSRTSLDSNYTVLLRHGSLANCPCFRIPTLVATGPESLVLLVEARWSSSECSRVKLSAPPQLLTEAFAPPVPAPAPAPPSLALISSTDGGRTFSSNLTILSVKCGPTCNPHAVWTSAGGGGGGKLVVVFKGSSGIEVTSTSDPTGKGGWNKAASLAPWIGEDWSHAAYPGPGAALAVQVPVLTSTPTVRVPTASTPASAQMAPLGGRTKERLLFCGHAGAYAQDVAFYSDDGGATFNLSASTPYNQEDNVLKGMDECSMAQLNNGSVLLILRNFGGYKEHDPRGFHNPRCRDHGICKAYSRSDDYGLTWLAPEYFGDVKSGSCEAGVLVDKVDGSLYISVGASDTPPNTGRMRMTLHRSKDGGASWDNGVLLDANRTAYSQLVTLDSRRGEIGVLWEALSPDLVFIGEMRLQWISTATVMQV